MTEAQIKKIVTDILGSDCLYKPWNLSVLTYNQSQFVPVLDKCFAYMFTNIGDTIATVNEMIVFPSATPATALGDSRTVMAHNLNIFSGSIKLSFRVPLNAAPLIEIVQLFYTDNNK